MNHHARHHRLLRPLRSRISEFPILSDDNNHLMIRWVLTPVFGRSFSIQGKDETLRCENRDRFERAKHLDSPISVVYRPSKQIDVPSRSVPDVNQRVLNLSSRYAARQWEPPRDSSQSTE